MGVGQEQAASLLGSLSALIRTARAAAQRHNGEMGAAGTPLALLKTLRSGPSRPGELATTLQVAPSVVSRTIVRLEQTGLVERTPDLDDARSSWIALTDAGRDRLDRLQQVFVEEARLVLDDWTDAEAEQAAALIARLDQAITRVYAESEHRLMAEVLRTTDVAPDPADSITLLAV